MLKVWFISCAESSRSRELNFHIWNANSQSFARSKSEAKMAAHGGKFCTSVSVLFAVLYVSSSPLHDFNLQFFVSFGFKNIHNRMHGKIVCAF